MPRIDDAYKIYKKHIYDTDKLSLLAQYNLKVAGSVPSVIWEAFGAALTGQRGTGHKGADLQGWEVKSAVVEGSFEYQYHLNTGASKLDEDCSVTHLFCAYSRDYKSVSVWAIPGCELADTFFDAWRPQYGNNYSATAPASERRQRFRKNVPYSHVAMHGSLILRIEDGKIVERHDNVLNDFCN